MWCGRESFLAAISDQLSVEALEMSSIRCKDDEPVAERRWGM